MEKNIKIDYLRLSITDMCNLNCLYCTPLTKHEFLKREEVLRYEEITRMVGVFVKAGIRKVRITGGEPLIKKDIIDLVKMLKSINGLEELSMTTNAVDLSGIAWGLKKAGLGRINISLNTLNKKRFELITGFDYFKDVWDGVNQALACGFNTVKLNFIPLRGINDDEIIAFARLALETKLIVRFIELFPVNNRSKELNKHAMTNKEIKQMISGYFGELVPISGVTGNGPANYFRLKGFKGVIGFINSYTENFCSGCSRVRVNCAGRVSPCLFSGYLYDIKPLLRQGIDDSQLLAYIKGIINGKSCHTKDTVSDYKIEMSSVGG